MVVDTIDKPKMKEKDDLLVIIKQLEEINHIMAHNLRGSASNIKMISEILLDRESDQFYVANDAELLSTHEALVMINRSSSALMNTLGRLIDEVATGVTHKMEYDECDIKQIVESITDQLNGVVLQKHTTITMHLSVKHFQYVKVYLESLLYNLVSNALKYSRPHVPLEITISTHKKTAVIYWR
jgi:signal transduction histidine kinase